jgi:signal peptidase II
MKNFIINRKYFLIAISCSIIIAYLDLLTKSIAFNTVEENFINTGYSYIIVTDFFNIVRVWNFGVSFGMFNDLQYSKEIFVIIVSLISIGLMIWLYNNTEKILAISLSLILGGAFGNLIDRMINSAVADFLDLHIAGYHWPAFNLADISVFCGVALIIFDDLILKKRKNVKNK